MGATSGATPTTAVIWDKRWRASAPSKRSRTTASGRATQRPAAAPWTARKSRSPARDGAAAQASAAAVKATNPPRKTGRRPKRSATGPPNTGAREKPTKKKLKVSAPRPGAAWKPLSMAGTPGRFMSIDRAGSADTAPRKAVNPNERDFSIMGRAFRADAAPFRMRAGSDRGSRRTRSERSPRGERGRAGSPRRHPPGSGAPPLRRAGSGSGRRFKRAPSTQHEKSTDSGEHTSHGADSFLGQAPHNQRLSAWTRFDNVFFSKAD